MQQIFPIIIGGSVIILSVIIIAYIVLSKMMNKKDMKYKQQLKHGTDKNEFSMDVIYQKLYVNYMKIPFLKRYLSKIRRRLEILNVEDEYLTRKDSSKIITKILLILIPVIIIVVMLTKDNLMLMAIMLLFIIFFVETLADGSVSKIDNKILKQQIDFFSEIRHAYHEFNMVEEAIYQTAQNDELEISRQAEKIYEVLISNDPEAELEKYYDIAPNSYLKEFAGVSYLTKEFGDRKVDGASLYLKNLNNITQEMQLEILKRDKLDYVFQSLSVIAAIPILALEPLKAWAVSQFAFTTSFYNGKIGLIAQLLIVILTFICYILIRKIKDNGSTAIAVNVENPWQAKLYSKPYIKKIVDLFIPKKGTKEHRKVTQMLKDAASKLKIEWFYENRLVATIVAFIIAFTSITLVHKKAIEYIYTEPVTDYNMIGMMSTSETKKANQLREQYNYFIDKLINQPKVTVEKIIKEMEKSEYYEKATEEEMQKDAERILDDINLIKSETIKWPELLFAIIIGIMGYMGPYWLLIFQIKMRQLEMEDEVMQFQTIILMLMKIERVSVEIILEWLERYSNIFREPISKCVNNYESGAWESLEDLKNDISYGPLIRIVESLQAAVEKIPIKDAFDELDTERDYYREKRKESNDRLIARKGKIGQVIGFAPMVCLFVGYLIVPLVVIGMASMTSSFSSMSGYM